MRARAARGFSRRFQSPTPNYSSPPRTWFCMQAAQSWQVHYTGDGRPYYHDPTTGSTQWDAPAGYA